MTVHTLYVGLVTRDNAHVKPSARNAILDDAARTFGGYTAIRSEGGYTLTNGYIVHEPSLRIELITDKPLPTVRAFAERARLLANQETVLLTSTAIYDAELIGEQKQEKAA